jgi:predicted metal-dependent hydrolase
VIKVRKIGFEFPDDIPFWFNPRSREASLVANGLSMMAPAFERYFIRAIRDAMPRIRSTAVRDEADLFCKQEGQHSRTHIDHQEMLLRRHPALEAVRDRVTRSYAELYETESTEFALAYATIIELGFKPMAKFLVGNRQILFTDGDPRVTALVLWHFVEEFEHRSAMFNVYQDVVGDYFYRVRTIGRTRRHVAMLAADVRQSMEACEPLPAEDPNAPKIPRIERWKLTLGLLETFSPLHDPNAGKIPRWIEDWMAKHEAGQDMTRVML